MASVRGRVAAPGPRSAWTGSVIDQRPPSRCGLLDRRGLPLFFQQVAGAALATGVAVLLVAWDVDVRSSLVVAAGTVVLLAGRRRRGCDQRVPGHRGRAGLRGGDVDRRH